MGENMPSIPATTTFGYIGIIFLISGCFMTIAGFGIIKPDKVKITPGKTTWVLGIILIFISGFFLVADMGKTRELSEGMISTAVVGTVSMKEIEMAATLSVNETANAAAMATKEYEVSMLVATSFYASPTATMTITPTVTPYVPILYYRVIVDDAVIYQEPDINSVRIETIAKDQKVEVIDRTGTWCLVEYTVGSVRTTGWIKQEYLQVLK
jgi:hypothetical protein